MLNVTDAASRVCSSAVTTKKVDWQRQCWGLAEERLPFELHDIETRHFMFCFELCAEYDYHFTYTYGSGRSVAHFKPLQRF